MLRLLHIQQIRTRKTRNCSLSYGNITKALGSFSWVFILSIHPLLLLFCRVSATLHFRKKKESLVSFVILSSYIYDGDAGFFHSEHSWGSTNSSRRSSEFVNGMLYVNDTISSWGRRTYPAHGNKYTKECNRGCEDVAFDVKVDAQKPSLRTCLDWH